MSRILDLFDRDVTRHIEEVIKVDQTRADVVRHEIEEYVVTGRIRDAFRAILERFQETPNKPHEGIGIWISGFFGSGKSSFAKVLGYILENRKLGEASASELFGAQAADPGIQALLKTVNKQIPTKAVIFDVSTDQAVTDAEEKLTDIVYRVLLRNLGYATDREIAEMEFDLETRKHLQDFEKRFEDIYQQAWNEAKYYPATARSKMSRVLHELDPATYPNADSWAHAGAKVTVSANFVAKRAWDMVERRAQGHALFFVVDEVGQYVARSTEKMLDLQGLIQALGREGHNRHKEWKGQVWLAATSQERLSEVVDNLDGKQVELARLRDRFQTEVDLVPSDIREVTAKRVLKKKPAGAKELTKLFEQHKGKIADATRLSGQLEPADLSADAFVELYPFLPYQIGLVISVVSGLRTQGGAGPQVGGANRTVIKLAQEVLINERVRLGEAPIGRLVTLDVVYDLQEGLVTSERKRDVAEIQETFGLDGIATKVAKALALLQFVDGLPRTVDNLAALLHPALDAAPQREAIRAALTQLKEAHKVRETDKGWELLSLVGKSWEAERRGLAVSPRARDEILLAAAEQAFEDVGGFRYRNVKTFTASPVVNDRRFSRSGQIELNVRLIPDPGAVDAARSQARERSNAEQGRNAIHWVVPLPEDVIREVDELHRSHEMVTRHERNHLSPDQSRLLQEEKGREQTHRTRVGTQLKRAFGGGDSFFRGVKTPIQEYGSDLQEAVHGALRDAVPELYPKFEMAAAQVGSGDPVKVLQASLAGLPVVFYQGEGGLAIVRKQGGAFQVDPDAAPLKEVLGYVEERMSYGGEKPQGKLLESRFTGIGYGWDFEAVALVTAALFRQGLIEVYSGKRYTSYAEPGVQDVFRRLPTFRAASFSPREGQLTFKELSQAAQALERLFGEEVAIEEGALAAAVAKHLPAEANRAHRVLSLLEANGLPGAEQVREMLQVLEQIPGRSAEETVRAYHGQRDAVREAVDLAKQLEKALSEDNLATLRRAREAVERFQPDLVAVGQGDTTAAEAEALKAAISADDFYRDLQGIAHRARRVSDAHAAARRELGARVENEARRLLDDLRNRPEWTAIPEPSQRELSAPFAAAMGRSEAAQAELRELDALLHALPTHYATATGKLVALVEQARGTEDGKEPVVRTIKVSRFVQQGLRTKEDVDEAVERLRTACLEAIARGETIVLE